MSLERKIAWLFRACALINWTASIRGIIDPVGYLSLLGGASPEYTFVFRLWSAFVFMFGCMFWEVSRDVCRKAALIKYNWIEKTITALAVTLGFMTGDTPSRLMVLIIFTNWLWIPFILYYEIRLRGALNSRLSPAMGDAPSATS